MWTVPSGATKRMSSFVLFELNVIECGPRSHQVTVPPTGILMVLVPNSSTLPELFGTPEPASTAFGLPGSVTSGTGGLPCRSAATAGTSGATAFANCFCPRANCAAGDMIVLLAGTTVIFPCISSRCSAHMKRYVPGEVAPEICTVHFWPELSQPLL